MPANINFTEFTDEEIFLEDKEAANIFFGEITVPDATLADPGVVKKAAAVASLGVLTTYTITTLLEDGSTAQIEVVSKEDGDLMRSKINELIVALQAAGSLA
jgi:hypothetical protein